MVTLLEQIAAGPLTGAVWGFAQEPEFAACKSRLRMLNGDPAKSLSCVVLHGETGETAHCAKVNSHDVFWSDAEAKIAEAWFGILPTCANCRAHYRPSDGGPYCGARCQLADKHSPADDYEAEAAA